MDTNTSTPAKKSRSWARRLALPAFLLLLVLIVVCAYQLLRVPTVGGLHLGTAYGEPDLELYVGDKLIGLNRAEVSWSEIFGWNGEQPLGIILPPDAGPVPRTGSNPALLGEVTAERLAGEGAMIVHASYGNPCWQSNGRSEFSRREILLRRSDGSLDQVFCLDCRLTDLLGRPYRVLIPIRVRHSSGKTGGYFTSEPRGGPLGRFNSVLNCVFVDWNFESSELPDDVASEIGEHELWRPSP